MAPNLERALNESYYLLTFCTRVRIQMNEAERLELGQHVANIVAAQQSYCTWLALPQEQRAAQPILTPAQATNFWTSYINLSNIAAPATIESIKYFFDVVEPTPVLPSRYATGQRRPARAPFSRVAIVALLLCLGASLVSYVGTTTLAEFDADYQHWTAMSVAARPGTRIEANKDSQGRQTLTVFDARGTEVLQVNPHRIDRFRDAFNYLIVSPGVGSDGTEKRSPATTASAATPVPGRPAAAAGASQREEPVNDVLPPRALDVSSAHAAAPRQVAAAAEPASTRAIDDQEVEVPCSLGKSPENDPQHSLPLWKPCQNNWLKTSQRTSIIADELVHALAELQAERNILWTVVVPMNLVLHPGHTIRAITHLNRDIDDPTTLPPALLRNPITLRVVLTEMVDNHVPIPTNLPPPASELIAIRQEAVLFLAALQNYILPVLFGLLGACVQVVRTTSRSIENFTFMRGALSRYWARLVLGMVAGPAINWLIDPKGNLLGFTTNGVVEQPTITSHLGPIALAFVAGYAIEILFSILDKFITVFRDPGPTPAATRERSAAVV